MTEEEIIEQLTAKLEAANKRIEELEKENTELREYKFDCKCYCP